MNERQLLKSAAERLTTDIGTRSCRPVASERTAAYATTASGSGCAGFHPNQRESSRSVIAVGLALGRLFGLMMFYLPSLKLSETGDGLVAIGVTFLCYAATMLAHGNGFIAVFVAALAIRGSSPDDAFHTAMAEFAGQIERVLVMLVLVLLGWALGDGLLASLTWQGALLAVALLVIFRPLASWLAFRGSSAPRFSKRLIGIFGIRGIGTIYYLLYALHRGEFAEQDQLWAIAGLAILISILVHGVVSTPLMTHADKLRKRNGANAAAEIH